MDWTGQMRYLGAAGVAAVQCIVGLLQQMRHVAVGPQFLIEQQAELRYTCT